MATMTDDDRFLRLPDVERLTGLRKSTIYDLIAKREFPDRRQIAPKVVIWLESEVRRWMAERLAAAKKAA
jgi:prophage regulatory protein